MTELLRNRFNHQLLNWGTFGRRQGHQLDAIGKAPEVRLVPGGRTAVELGGECQYRLELPLAGPGGVWWQLGTQLVDLGHQPLLEVTAPIHDEHGISRDAWQALDALVEIG